MNTYRPDYLDTQYIYRDYGGCVFKLPRNKDLEYQSIELQEYYYWTLAEIAHKHLISEKTRKSNPSTTITQVAGWEITPTPVIHSQIKQTSHQLPTTISRYIELSEIKKPLRDKLIASALAQVFTTTNAPNTNNPFQYIESMT